MVGTATLYATWLQGKKDYQYPNPILFRLAEYQVSSLGTSPSECCSDISFPEKSSYLEEGSYRLPRWEILVSDRGSRNRSGILKQLKDSKAVRIRDRQKVIGCCNQINKGKSREDVV